MIGDCIGFEFQAGNYHTGVVQNSNEIFVLPNYPFMTASSLCFLKHELFITFKVAMFTHRVLTQRLEPLRDAVLNLPNTPYSEMAAIFVFCFLAN